MNATPIAQSLRFGFGPRAGDDFSSSGDLAGALAAELNGPGPGATPGAPSLASASDGLAAIETQRAMRRVAGGAVPHGAPHPVRDILAADRADTMARALASPLGFRERLVTFWTNHFTVSAKQGDCGALAGAFRREAIDPNVTGRFSDMLRAVMRHPAMLRYLENAASVGPDSPVGLTSHRGLNENLARECLELHTLSPASGYTQTDVTNFAAILTGWSVQTRDIPYGFMFKPRAHQPGEKILLGRRFPEGEQGGIDALAFLASHPATHTHLATKLVRHFGADRPDPREVRMVEAALRDTDGDLLAASLVLLDLPSARRKLGKLRSPQDLVIGAFRALDLPASSHPDAASLLAFLGQPLFEAPLPNGWPDTAADWLGPQSMIRRVDLAWTLAGHASPDRDPVALAHATLGGLIRPDTAFAVAHAGSRREAVALLLASPEFQRR